MALSVDGVKSRFVRFILQLSYWIKNEKAMDDEIIHFVIVMAYSVLQSFA
ncbi:hypothetical protein [Comamonas composti]|nr:hypothetical protein [Comamonas composti]